MRADTKAQLRQKMQLWRTSLTSTQKKEIDQGMFESLLQNEYIQKSKTIFTYYSVGTEISTHAFIEECLKQGKTVCIPKCGPNHTMTAHQISSKNDLIAGKFGIPEPSDQCTPMDSCSMDVIIVPCLCADRKGHRIGYGGGYYDRYLKDCSAAHSIVLCPAVCVQEALPTGVFDYPCDTVITEKGGLA